MCARNDNGLANEMRASKAMFGWLSTKGKTGLLEFLGVWSRMWMDRESKRRVKEERHLLESYCVDFVKLD
jgi:hypothetical protein